MNTLVRLALGIMVMSGVQAGAQDREGHGPGDRPPPPREGRGQNESLTTEQVAQVKAILSKYDPATVTAEQVRAIHAAIRAAGLRGGPAMGEAIRAAGFDPEILRALAPPPERPRGGHGEGRMPESDREGMGPGGGEGPGEQGGEVTPDQSGPAARDGHSSKSGQGKYSLDQAVSDRAQLSTLAFSGLAFLTGDFGGATFMPPGKVCDYFGFQYMRDIDAAGKGHNPMFLSRVAANVMHILNEGQRKLFEDLATEQAPQFEQLALKRMPLIKAFHRERDGDRPQGAAGLSREAVIRYVGDIYAEDAELAYRRAEVFGKVVASLTAEQKAYLAKMKFGDFNTWPERDERSALKRPAEGVPKFYNVAYMTYASEFFSWYAGSVKADVYFCPERHGTYFGGFFMKDMPAMGKRNYDISTAVTGDSGEKFLTLLNPEQRANLTSIPERQKKKVTEMVGVRTAMSIELRKFLGGGQADKQKVLALGRRYGELDGDVSWMYAMAFAKVNRTLTVDQRGTMMKLRNLDGYHSAPAYLYSHPLPVLPVIPDTDFLFGSSAPASFKVDAGGVVAALPMAGLTLTSDAVTNGGLLPREFTGFGSGATLPLKWNGAPATTRNYAIVMHHIDPAGNTKWYWLLYNIPAGTTSLPKDVKGVGIQGNNSVNGKAEYAPPHSKGPGVKTYVLTLYALSAPVELDVQPDKVSRDVLLAAMKDHVIATAEMTVEFSRPAEATEAAAGSASRGVIR